MTATFTNFQPKCLFRRIERHAGPKNTPKEVIEKLNKEINAVLDEPVIGTPEAFGALIVAETERWKKVIEGSGVTKVD